MNSEKVKILIVEDDMIIGAKISMQLANLGYEVTGIIPRGEEAILHVENNVPDIILLDINLKGNLDGIETATQMQVIADVPIIYVTANTDEVTFNRAKATRPYAFIAKPMKNLDLQRAIELTISRLADNHHVSSETAEAENSETPFILSDRIFVKHGGKMVKIFITDILYIEADRNYCQIFTHNQKYTLSITLKAMEEKLPSKFFVRTHRSFMANISQIDEVSESHVLVGGKHLSLSHSFRDELLQRLQTF
ncbi:MAG: LytTR family transcriptional regulator DNA-binding domain-containing protein [Spirosomaceae bacterium]|nr:LytTR family transcriptional regulator DNA-binding domain-containing protein [Spirosomataceae bacterium]